MAIKGGSLDWYDPSARVPAPAVAAKEAVTAPAPPANGQRAKAQQPPPPPAHGPVTPSSSSTAKPTSAPVTKDKPAAPTESSVVASLVETEEVAAEAEGGWADEAIAFEEDLASQAQSAIKTASATASVSAPVTRQLDTLEVARSVEAATKAKESLARESLMKAKDEVLERRARLQAEHAERQRRLEEEERQLKALEEELHKGCSSKEEINVQALRKTIEAAGRELATLEKDVNAKRLAMQKATEAYVSAEEMLTAKRAARQKLEEEMLETFCRSGRRRTRG